MKRKLLILDGFCHSGKTKTFNYIYETLKNVSKFDAISSKDLIDINDSLYQNKEKALNKTNKLLIQYLLTLPEYKQLVITNGLFISDFVYSKLYDRDFSALYYFEELAKEFEIINICFMPPSYKYYIKECNKIGEDIVYTEAEYNYIIMLYKKFNTLNYECDNVYINVLDEDTPKILYKKMCLKLLELNKKK